MPRDKSETHKKILPCIKKEFLEKGFEKASLNVIATNAGITAAGLYRHFPSKEAMFIAMVAPGVEKFDEMYERSMDETFTQLSNEDFLKKFCGVREKALREVMDLIYENFDEFKLLLTCAKGTKYEDFEHDMATLEAMSTRKLINEMKKRKIHCNKVSDDELHILATTYMSAIFEVVKHDYSKDRALEHIKFIGKLFHPGWQAILGF
jgi:AcrR family transcriptional regulator